MHKAHTQTPDNLNFLTIENYKSNTCNKCDFKSSRCSVPNRIIRMILCSTIIYEIPTSESVTK